MSSSYLFSFRAITPRGTYIYSFFHSFIHMDVSPNTGGHPYIHIYVIGAHKVTDYEYNVYMII